MMKREAMTQGGHKSIKNISYVVLVALAVCGLLQCGYTVGREHTIREAKPYTVEGVQYVQYGEEVHDYGTTMYVTVECTQ